MPAPAAISFRAPVAAPLRARASARRVHARRAVVAALPQKGKTALTGVLRVPKSEEAKMDAMWASHEKYMRDTHVIAGGPETTDEKPRLLEYYVSKAVELTDPIDAGAWRADTLRSRLLEGCLAASARENISLIFTDFTVSEGTRRPAPPPFRASGTEPDDPCPSLHRRRLRPHG